jgi:hypothetical protein
MRSWMQKLGLTLTARHRADETSWPRPISAHTTAAPQGD